MVVIRGRFQKDTRRSCLSTSDLFRGSSVLPSLANCFLTGGSWPDLCEITIQGVRSGGVVCVCGEVGGGGMVCGGRDMMCVWGGDMV